MIGASSAKVSALAENIRPGWKGLPGTKTHDYWVHSSVMKKMKCCEHGPNTNFLLL
jgi:hypothetical protein